MKGWFRATRSGVGHGLGRAALLTAVGLLLGADPVRAQDDKLPKAEKILEKSIEGRGGRAAFEKLRSRVSKGTIEVSGAGQPVKGTIEIYEEAPNKKYVVMDLGPAGKFEGGSDGEVQWDMSTSKGASIRSGEEKAVAERQNTFNALLFWKEHYEKVETVAKEQVDDHPCYKLVLTPKFGPPETVYLDRRNGFPAKVEQVPKSEAGDAQVITRQDDFKETDGVQLARKLTRQVTVAGQTQTITTIWESIEHNVSIPAERFALPPGVKVLLDQPMGKPGESAGKREGG